ALIFAQLGWVDEEAIPRGEQRVAAEAASRQPELVLLGEEQRLIGALGAEIFAELEAEIRGRVALCENSRRRLAVDGAVGRREKHRDAAARGLLEHRQQRRALEPL